MIAPPPERFLTDEQDESVDDRDFLARMAAATPQDSLFNLIQRHRNKPLIDVLMGASGEAITHPGLDFMLGAKALNRNTLPEFLQDMSLWMKSAPMRDIEGNIANMSQRVANAFLRARWPHFMTQGPLRTAPESMFFADDDIVRLSRPARTSATPNPLTHVFVRDEPKLFPDTVKGAVEGMARLRAAAKLTNKTKGSPWSKITGFRDLAEANYMKFFDLLEEAVGAENVPLIFENMLK